MCTTGVHVCAVFISCTVRTVLSYNVYSYLYKFSVNARLLGGVDVTSDSWDEVILWAVGCSILSKIMWIK